jgi:hypothetical protein
MTVEGDRDAKEVVLVRAVARRRRVRPLEPKEQFGDHGYHGARGSIPLS